MSLKTGDYYLYVYDLNDRQIGALILTVTPTAVVVQPHNTRPHKVSNDALTFANTSWDCIICRVVSPKGRLKIYNHF